MTDVLGDAVELLKRAQFALQRRDDEGKPDPDYEHYLRCKHRADRIVERIRRRDFEAMIRAASHGELVRA